MESSLEEQNIKKNGEIQHPLEHSMIFGYRKPPPKNNPKEWKLVILAKEKPIETVEETLPYVKYTILDEKFISENEETFIFRAIDGTDSGPSAENLKGAKINGIPIEYITEINFKVNLRKGEYTLKQICNVFYSGAMWFIGALSFYNKEIIGVRMKRETDDGLYPSIRFWVETGSNRNIIVETIKNEFMTVLFRYDIECKFSEITEKLESITKKEHPEKKNHKILDEISENFTNILSDYDLFYELQKEKSQSLFTIERYQTGIIQDIEKKSTDLISKIEEEFKECYPLSISMFKEDFSNFLAEIKNMQTNSKFDVRTLIKDILPKQNKKLSAQKGYNNKTKKTNQSYI